MLSLLLLLLTVSVVVGIDVVAVVGAANSAVISSDENTTNMHP